MRLIFELRQRASRGVRLDLRVRAEALHGDVRLVAVQLSRGLDRRAAPPCFRAIDERHLTPLVLDAEQREEEADLVAVAGNGVVVEQHGVTSGERCAGVSPWMGVSPRRDQRQWEQACREAGVSRKEMEAASNDFHAEKRASGERIHWSYGKLINWLRSWRESRWP
jgi:hypothetical protein